MQIVHLVTVIVALVCLLAAAFDVKGTRINLTAAGLFLWVLSTLLVAGK